MSQPEPRTVLAVDGNSLLHRAFHASARTGFRLDGRPAWAVRGLLSQLSAAVDRASADAVVVGFDDRSHSVRKERWPTYKAQRSPKPDTLEQQIDLAIDVLGALGLCVVVPDGLEADDVLASVAAQAPIHGARTVVVTSDRDSFSLIDDHTRMLRILNGGVDASPMLDAAKLALVTGVRPDQYADLAALRGDASDNLPGVRGFGAKTAVSLLTALDSAPAAFADARGDGERCRAAVGAARTATLAGDEARERYDLNRAVMAQVTTVDVGALDPEGQVGAVPLATDAVRDVYSRFDLHVVSAIRSLTLSEPSRAVEPAYVDPRWRAPSGPRHQPLPKLPTASEPEPQLTLF
jgi:5'-3' exonuclease